MMLNYINAIIVPRLYELVCVSPVPVKHRFGTIRTARPRTVRTPLAPAPGPPASSLGGDTGEEEERCEESGPGHGCGLLGSGWRGAGPGLYREIHTMHQPQCSTDQYRCTAHH